MEKVPFDDQKLTLLATLYGKAIDARAANPILGDKFADDVLHRIDYDFARLHVPKGADISLPVRAKHLDGWTREFLAAHPRAVVLHLGCGLDSRPFRIDPPPTVAWYDVDFPEVIAIRRRVYPARAGLAMIGSSVTEPEWLDEVPRDRPALVVAEGLVPYLPPADGIALFRRIVDRFSGGELIFDASSRLVLRMIRLYSLARMANVRLVWAIDDPHELSRAIPRLVLVDDVPFLTLPELVERLPRPRAAILRLLGHTRFARRAFRHLRYRF